ncbi:hypothetical protein GCM10010214_00670 [Streptomyces abikoensis]|nr:hypothetical protein GCM10010214_00670 [Streptomyces abikoensis]
MGWIDWYTNWVFVVWSLVKVRVTVTVSPGLAVALSTVSVMGAAGAAEAGWAMQVRPAARARVADRPRRLNLCERMAEDSRHATAA